MLSFDKDGSLLFNFLIHTLFRHCYIYIYIYTRITLVYFSTQFKHESICSINQTSLTYCPIYAGL